jgi:hypothetical protein
MAARLGYLLWWLGLLIGLPAIGLAIYSWNTAVHPNAYEAVFFATVGAVVILIGRGLRFLFAGD